MAFSIIYFLFLFVSLPSSFLFGGQGDYWAPPVSAPGQDSRLLSLIYKKVSRSQIHGILSVLYVCVTQFIITLITALVFIIQPCVDGLNFSLSREFITWHRELKQHLDSRNTPVPFLDRNFIISYSKWFTKYGSSFYMHVDVDLFKAVLQDASKGCRTRQFSFAYKIKRNSTHQKVQCTYILSAATNRFHILSV